MIIGKGKVMCRTFIITQTLSLIHILLKAVPMKAEEDLGLVGEITRVDVTLIRNSLENGTIPVVATIAAGENDGNTYNINADIAVLQFFLINSA